MVKYTSTKQLSFEDFETHLGKKLDGQNRWVILASQIPLGRPPKLSKDEKQALRKEARLRNRIEGKFGEGKDHGHERKLDCCGVFRDEHPPQVAAIFFVFIFQTAPLPNFGYFQKTFLSSAGYGVNF